MKHTNVLLVILIICLIANLVAFTGGKHENLLPKPVLAQGSYGSGSYNWLITSNYSLIITASPDGKTIYIFGHKPTYPSDPVDQVKYIKFLKKVTAGDSNDSGY